MSFLKFDELETHWQKYWLENKTFQPEINSKKPAFYIQVPYPYPSGAMHLGHARTYTTTDIIAKYHRLRGFNVLMPMAWHVSGTPVIAEVEALKNNNEETIKKFTKTFRIPEKDLHFLKEPESYVNYMVEKAEYGYKKGFKYLGLGIDWRREFTTIYPHYNKFIQWQFKKLNDKGYLIQKAYPIRFCPQDKQAVGDHDLKEGEGVGITEYTFVKFPVQEQKNSEIKGASFLCGTLRPETIYGITNLWINPAHNYSLIELNNSKERFILSSKAVKKAKHQFSEFRVIKELFGKDLVGLSVKAPIAEKVVLVLPSSLSDDSIASGIVLSVPSDAPHDLVALRDLQANVQEIKKFNLSETEIKNLRPIEIIEVPGMGKNAAEYLVKQLGIKSLNDKEKLDKAKELVYKTGFFKGVLLSSCGKYAKMPTKDAKEVIKESLLKNKNALNYFELDGKVICRCSSECVVALLNDQWFIKYSDKKWKQESVQTLAEMKIVPESFRKQYENVFSWLEEKPCTRAKGLGTKFPFDEKFIIEPLSDSTIYMAFFTISHLIKEIPVGNLNDKVFDFVFLGKGSEKDISKETKISTATLNKMKQEFDYWYPLAFNISALELIPNHMSFSIFNHTAIFPKNRRQKGTINLGMLILEGKKMSSSKGNVILVNDLCKKLGTDYVRLFLMNFVEPWEEMNWQAKEVEKGLSLVNNQVNYLYEKANNVSGASPLNEKKLSTAELWLLNKFKHRLSSYYSFMNSFELRKSLQEITFKFFNDLKWFERRNLSAKENPELFKFILTEWTKAVSPFMPHLAEEFWQKALKNKNSVFTETINEKISVDYSFEAVESLVEQMLNDINTLLKLGKIAKPKKAVVVIASNEKFHLFKKLIGKAKNGGISALNKEIYAFDFFKKNPKLAKQTFNIIKNNLNSLSAQDMIDEKKVLVQAQKFLEKELNLEIEVLDEEMAVQTIEKAPNALPRKPAIIIQ